VHSWGEEGVDWDGLNEAPWFIGGWLRRWMRMHVSDMKEKFGTVRVYCSFGWDSFYSIFYPGYCWIKPWWPNKLDSWLSDQTPILKWLNYGAIPLQKWAYAYRYKKAVQKWPHLYDEIVSGADWGELFEGVVPGYVHSNFWQEVTSNEDTDSANR
jgi:hypothetical protein